MALVAVSPLRNCALIEFEPVITGDSGALRWCAATLIRSQEPAVYSLLIWIQGNPEESLHIALEAPLLGGVPARAYSSSTGHDWRYPVEAGE